MEKERIYITHLTLHARNFRPTINFSRAAEKGRLYSSISRDSVEDSEANTDSTTLAFDIPKDLLERMDRGEVELMMPQDGILMYAGRDTWELVDKIEKKERRQLIHRNRHNTWRKNDKNVK